eukprot:7310551-Pyramimonas_sp.AAC.1
MPAASALWPSRQLPDRSLSTISTPISPLTSGTGEPSETAPSDVYITEDMGERSRASLFGGETRWQPEGLRLQTISTRS